MEPSKVEKFSTTDRGNGLRALAPLRPGELLFRSDPLAYTVSKGSRGVVCDRCLLGYVSLSPESKQCGVRYAGDKKAWQDHKRECKCLKSCKPRYPPDSVRLLGRVVFKLVNINKLTEDKKEGLRQLALTFQHFMREEIQDASQLPPSFDIFEAFAKVICNSFTICNAEMQEVGVGLYPSMSLLNHSCDPNCSIVFNGPHLLLRAVRDVEAGEELTICYLDMLMTSEERRKQLRDQYCFDCDCFRCQTQDKDADMLTGDEQVWKEVQESLKKIEELKAHWTTHTACHLFSSRIFYPGNHPVRGVQIMKVGKLQLHQGMFPQAMKNLRLAFDIMRVTHGREHSLIEDLILLLEECDANIR
ncbi:hypothetical protein MG293_013208, partial [Ovis ammon polii]